MCEAAPLGLSFRKSKTAGDNLLMLRQCSANSQTRKAAFVLVCKDGVEKAKANLVSLVKSSEKCTLIYFSSKRKVSENVGLLLDGAGDSVTKDTENTKVFNAAFTSFVIGKTDL